MYPPLIKALPTYFNPFFEKIVGKKLTRVIGIIYFPIMLNKTTKTASCQGQETAPAYRLINYKMFHFIIVSLRCLDF
jgi:hypothetical protein